MERLTEQQRQAVEALLGGLTVKEAAQAAGVHRNTVYYWLKQPAFREALARAEVEASTDPQQALSLMALRAAVGLVKGLRVPGDGEHREAETQKR
jgi:transposase-like protein